MEKYEILYILPAKHTEEELEILSKKIRDIVISHGGEVSEEHYMGRRKLAYPIKHVRNGQYYLIIFSAEQEAINKLNATLRLTTELLRHLIIKRDPYVIGVPKLQEEYSIVRKEKERGLRRKPDQERKSGSEMSSRRIPEREFGGKEKDTPEKVDRNENSREKIMIEDLDKKLDKILTDDIL